VASLEDVEDVEKFAAHVARKTLAHSGRLTEAELEEAVDEGIVLLYEIHRIWDPARCERFSALALELLSRRLIDWWRTNLRASGRGRIVGHTPVYHAMIYLDQGIDDGDDTSATRGDDLEFAVYDATAA
jgi:hypothetical protein